MADISEIKDRLASRAEAVASMLLAGGKRVGPQWHAGSVNGEAGKSLRVELSGPKAGIWSDFATGSDSGDLLDLWCAARGMSLPEALDDARAWLGIERPKFDRQPKREYKLPPKPRCRAPQAHGATDYLRYERHISEDALRAYKIAEDDNRIVFPFLKPDGVLALAKTREAVDGAKPKPTAADCEPILFGWQAIPSDARDVVICEGEIDALTWWDYGFPCMSVPFGGGKGAKQQWIENEFERLERFERIFIAMDTDQPGQEAAQEIVMRLGRHRCYVVDTPEKDANACKAAGISADHMADCIRNARSMDPEELRHASDYTDAVMELFWPDDNTPTGYETPYTNLRGKLLFRPGEMSLWTGATGSGKSQVLSDCTVHWISKGAKVCLASLEMAPAQSLKRMVKQAGGVDRPTEGYLRATMDFIGQGLWLYTRVGKSGVTELLEVFSYARMKYGCDTFVIDSLMRMGIPKDDYVGQEKAVFEIVDWAIRHNVHIHLVAHARKAGQTGGVPQSEDVGGASEIGSNAFNILGIWRNRRREDEVKSSDPEIAAKAEATAGVILNVSKQRNGDYEGKCGLWFDQENYRYRSDQETREYVRFAQPRDREFA